ncbi:hypothetical protein H0H87_012601 [Tephrocybe sp. NHM501043]|nr:hypothetical protein H0H87_012601 [Tephrocybe sp. NHM501043]
MDDKEYLKLISKLSKTQKGGGNAPGRMAGEVIEEQQKIAEQVLQQAANSTTMNASGPPASQLGQCFQTLPIVLISKLPPAKCQILNTLDISNKQATTSHKEQSLSSLTTVMPSPVPTSHKEQPLSPLTTMMPSPVPKTPPTAKTPPPMTAVPLSVAATPPPVAATMPPSVSHSNHRGSLWSHYIATY